MQYYLLPRFYCNKTHIHENSKKSDCDIAKNCPGFFQPKSQEQLKIRYILRFYMFDSKIFVKIILRAPLIYRISLAYYTKLDQLLVLPMVTNLAGITRLVIPAICARPKTAFLFWAHIHSW